MVALQQQKQLQPPTTTKGAMIPFFSYVVISKAFKCIASHHVTTKQLWLPFFSFSFFSLWVQIGKGTSLPTIASCA
jgi:hypothetical protein